MKQTTINEDGKYEVLESKYLIQRPWLTARLDSAKLPDGRLVPEYYVLEYPDWINVIAITQDGRMIMERQYRHAIGKTAFELPCGVIEKGEEPLADGEILQILHAAPLWKYFALQGTFSHRGIKHCL